MQILQFILVILGLIVLLAIIYYFGMKFIGQTKSSRLGSKFPPASYMNAIGSKCPDYWVYDGNTCINKFNISVAGGDKCYTDAKNKSKSFSPIRNWESINPRHQNVRERCVWMEKCGPEVENGSEVMASWLGVSDYC